jgi:cold shock CspA family protein
LEGVVVEFDEPRGLGVVEAGGRAYPFHCTQIADGTRTVEVGTAVTFDVRPGTLGRWEAAAVVKAAGRR